MVPHVSGGERLKTVSKTALRRQKLITVKLDFELANKIDFLASHLGVKKVEVLRQLVNKTIIDLGIWSNYKKSTKLYSKELNVKN